MAISISGDGSFTGLSAAETYSFDGAVSIAGTVTYEDVTNIDSVGVVTARSGVYFGSPGSGTQVDGNSTGINVTGTLKVNDIASLDSTTLSLGLEGGANGFINTQESLYVNIDSNNDETGKRFEIRHGATDASGTQLFTVLDSGNVGIGTDDPTAGTDGESDDLVIYRASGAAGMTIKTASNVTGAIRFADTDGASQGRIEYNHPSDYLRWNTGGSEKLRIDSSGNLSLAGDTDTYIGHPASDSLAVTTGDTERMRITSSGNVGIDATSPQTMLQIGDGSSGNGVPKLRLHRGSGSDYFEVDVAAGTPSLKAVGGGNMKFFTSNTERMMLSSSGEARFFASGVTLIAARNTASSGTSVTNIAGVFGSTDNTDGTVSFRVYTNGNVENTNDSYGQLSDIKLKENIVDATSQWDDFKAVRFRKFNFKEETGHETFTQLGVIAQELELVSPGLVYETPDRDEEGNDLGTTTKAVKSSILVKKAMVALQEAMERIETLEQRLADAGIA